MWLWIVATFVAFFVKGLCGFANTLVLTSILGFGVNNVNISPVELVLGFPPNVIMTVKNRKKLNAKVVVPLASLVLIGCVPGAFLLKNVDATYIKILFGVVIIGVALEMFFRQRSTKTLRESKAILAIIGIVSGALCGLFGIGALLAAYVGRVTNSSNEFKANISAVFCVENIFRIVLYSVMGVITLDSLKHAAVLFPVMLLGLFAGMKSGDVLDEKIVKNLVIILLIISGVVLILKSIM